MAKLTKDDVLKLAQLSRIRLSEEEIVQFAAELSSLLQYVEQLQAIDLDQYEPTSQVTGLVNVMRPDTEKQYGPTPEELLKNVPETKDGYIKVKRMVA